jgi:hypothetical protein
VGAPAGTTRPERPTTERADAPDGLGSRMVAMTNCPKCGLPVREESSSCPLCHARVRQYRVRLREIMVVLLLVEMSAAVLLFT